MAPEAPPLSSAELEAAPVAKESSSKDPSRDPVLDAASGDGAAKAPEPAPVKEGPEDVKLGEGEKKKKKRKKKSPGCGGKNKPSGFEEYAVDGPLTKEQVDTEVALYDPSKPFPQRMELCIQRYRARRKWDPIRMGFFTAYLTLGGIVTGQKQFFGGLDEKKMDDMDAEEIAMMSATDYIRHQDTGTVGDDEWEVDFAYVVRGFLSYKIPQVLFIRKLDELEIACRLIRNFLNYVIVHSVAPEYHANILEAIALCDQAEKELVLCCNVSNRMPGSFNTACSTIYGGFYEGVGDTDKTWKVPINRVAGYDEKTAKDLVTVAINKRGAPEQKAHGLERTVVRRDFMSLEVTEIILPVSEVESKDEDKTLPENKYFKKTQALGVIKVKPWLPEDPLVEYQELPKDQQEEFEIVLEKVVLQYCFLGMHLEARVHRCDDGLLFIDSVTAVMCSFFLRLENPNMTEDSDGDFE